MIKLISIIGIIILDRLTKYIVVHALKPGQAIHVTDFFNIVYIWNKGIVFGFFNNISSTAAFFLLIAANIIALIILIMWLIKPGNNNWITMGLSFVIGGAVGNFIDRLLYKGVIDFLDFHLSQYHWPAFNVADASVTVGTLLLGIGFIARTYASRSV